MSMTAYEQILEAYLSNKILNVAQSVEYPRMSHIKNTWEKKVLKYIA